jgi:hypothetical protein
MSRLLGSNSQAIGSFSQSFEAPYKEEADTAIPNVRVLLDELARRLNQVAHEG